MDLALYQDPLDYPDWRLTRVKSLVGENKLPNDNDDKYVHRALKSIEPEAVASDAVVAM